MTIADKFDQLEQIKEDIREAIVDKGVAVDGNAPFGDYAGKIEEIKVGGEGETVSASYVANGSYTLVPTEEGKLIGEANISINVPTEDRLPNFVNNTLDTGFLPEYLPFSITSNVRKEIYPYEFYKKYIGSVEFNNATVVNEYAFYGCNQLRKADLPKVKELKGNTFWNNANLTSVSIPELETISGSGYDFYNTNKLTSFDFPKLKTISSSCVFPTSLTTIDLPELEDTLNSVSAFEGLKNLQSFSAPKLKTVGERFLKDAKISQGVLSFPNVTEITKNAPFNGTSGITVLDLPNLERISSGNCICGTYLTELRVPKLKELRGGQSLRTLSYGKTMKVLELPSLEEIYDEAFSDNHFKFHFGKDYCYLNTAASSVFRESNDATFYVPYSSDHSILDAYKTGTNWSAIASRIYEDAVIDNVNSIEYTKPLDYVLGCLDTYRDYLDVNYDGTWLGDAVVGETKQLKIASEDFGLNETDTEVEKTITWSLGGQTCSRTITQGPKPKIALVSTENIDVTVGETSLDVALKNVGGTWQKKFCFEVADDNCFLHIKNGKNVVMFIRKDAEPTTSVYDKRWSTSSISNDVYNLVAGTYYVLIHDYASWTQTNLDMSIEGQLTLKPNTVTAVEPAEEVIYITADKTNVEVNCVLTQDAYSPTGYLIHNRRINAKTTFTDVEPNTSDEIKEIVLTKEVKGQTLSQRAIQLGANDAEGYTTTLWGGLAQKLNNSGWDTNVDFTANTTIEIKYGDNGDTWGTTGSGGYDRLLGLGSKHLEKDGGKPYMMSVYPSPSLESGAYNFQYMESGGVYTIKLSSEAWWESGKEIGRFNANQFSGKISISSDGREDGRYDIYYLKIWDGEELTHNYIPVVDANGVVSFYDVITRTVIAKRGTSTTRHA